MGCAREITTYSPTAASGLKHAFDIITRRYISGAMEIKCRLKHTQANVIRLGLVEVSGGSHF
jgi:hypothetical protein